MILIVVGLVLAAAWIWQMTSGRTRDAETVADLRSMDGDPVAEVDEFLARNHFAAPQPAAYDDAPPGTPAPVDAGAPAETHVMTWLHDHGVMHAQTQSQTQAQTTPVEHVVTEAAETAEIADDLRFDPIEPLTPLRPLAPLPPLPPLDADGVDRNERGT